MEGEGGGVGGVGVMWSWGGWAFEGFAEHGNDWLGMEMRYTLKDGVPWVSK